MVEKRSSFLIASLFLQILFLLAYANSLEQILQNVSLTIPAAAVPEAILENLKELEWLQMQMQQNKTPERPKEFDFEISLCNAIPNYAGDYFRIFLISHHLNKEKNRGDSKDKEINVFDDAYMIRTKSPSPNYLASCLTQGRNSRLGRKRQKTLSLPNNWLTLSRKSKTQELKTYFSSSGHLYHDHVIYNSREYCLDWYSEDFTRLQIILCEPNCEDPENADGIVCTTKCCGLNQVINYKDNESCSYAGKHFYVPTPIGNAAGGGDAPQVHLRVAYPSQLIPECTEVVHYKRQIGEDIDKHLFEVHANGSLLVLNPLTREWLTIPKGSYCLDGVQNFGSDEYYSGIPGDEVVIFCANEIHPMDTKLLPDSLHVFLIFISSGFLLITALVFILLFDKQNLRGWTILSQVICMFMSYFLLGISQLVGLDSKNIGSTGCIVIGILLHFFVLATFSWMTVLDFDVWRTFRSVHGASRAEEEKRKFFLYASFAYGLPISIVSVGLIFQKVFPESDSYLIVPGYGENSCYLSPAAQGYYAYYLIGLLLFCNFIFVVLTVWNIYWVKVNTAFIQKNSQKENQSTSKLFFKLFIIMGVTWIFEVVSWSYSNELRGNLWLKTVMVLDMVNILQPIAIFWIFVCNPKPLKQLMVKFTVFKILLSSCIDAPGGLDGSAGGGGGGVGTKLSTISRSFKSTRSCKLWTDSLRSSTNTNSTRRTMHSV